MEALCLTVMTRDLCHRFYRDYVNDPAVCEGPCEPYVYSPAQADAYFDSQQAPDRIVFIVLQGEAPIGEVKLKYIDHEKKECSLGIHLLNDTVKGQGYGTQAERLALSYAFDVLGLRAVNADSLLHNTRSQHVLEKVGFRLVRADGRFKYYRCENPAKPSHRGTIIFLNGVSSSGKTTLAKHLQSRLPEPFFLLNGDVFYHMMPEAKQSLPCFIKAMSGLCYTIKTYSDLGISVIVDHVLLGMYGTLGECVQLLHDYPVLFVHVTCPVEELRRREAARGDREPGQAESQLEQLQPQSGYDLTVNTVSTEACAEAIISALNEPRKETAFQRLWMQMNCRGQIQE